MNWFNKLYEKNISATGLAVFRIAFFTNFFFDVFLIFNKRQLFFDPVPFLKPFELDFTIPLLIWMIVVLGLIIGLYTRFLLILNYFFVLVFISSLSMFEYHMDFIYSGVCFVLMFVPLSKTLSIDSLLDNKNEKRVSQFYYFLVVFVGIGMVYFDSVLFKLSSNMWLKGLGVWLPASVPQMTILNDQWFLNQKGLMLFLGYLTLIFETLFIFLFWFKKMRIPILIVGVGLHLGILLEFPIPHFALGMLALYLLMVPNYIWDKLLSILRLKFKNNLSPFLQKKLTVLPIVECSKYSNKLTLKIVLFLLIVLQINSSLNAPFVKPFKKSLYAGLEKMNIKNMFDSVHESLIDFSKKTVGITPHGVFIDSHFRDYHHIVAIVYVQGNKEVWLPFIDENGMADSNCKASVWAYLGFRTNNANINPYQFEEGIKRFTAFWASKNNVDLNQARFLIRVKKIDLPNWEWEEDYLTNQIEKEWQNAGEAIWNQKEYNLELIKPIEEF